MNSEIRTDSGDVSAPILTARQYSYDIYRDTNSIRKLIVGGYFEPCMSYGISKKWCGSLT
jgi:hypothetical protein